MEYKYQDWTLEHILVEEHSLRESRTRALLALAEYYDKAIAETVAARNAKMQEAV
ncbi:hypothetical protein UFOVP890_82 [uncultured Caudovirales phage]|uniref:Uncharacterized protein n=1 Tax=uncultured Caudovirales phage TaxID=2100421 RepID=A0A6J5PJT9_9CAUD|nr:hypothetical protein UFOVP890_82 [uncultured Caudovirales phage]